MAKTIIKIISFSLILAMLLFYTNKVLKIKNLDGVYSFTKFYEQDDNTVDVLVLGSSHASVHFNTGILWEDYGMSSFIVSGPGQPIWNSYYALKEALKTQRPDLIILEGFSLAMVEDYSTEDSYIMRNNYGFKWSKNKVDSLAASSPRDKWSELFLEYSQYHTRYKELSETDFLDNQGDPTLKDWKGFICKIGTEALEAEDYTYIAYQEELNEKVELYYRKTLELARDKEIPIVVIVSPYSAIQEYQQARYNKANSIAEEYGVEFFNCNTRTTLDEIGIDFLRDSFDRSHLNYQGSEKFTKYIGKWLVERYDITDRRFDEKYASWQRDADSYRQTIYNYKVSSTSDMDEMLTLLNNGNYMIVVSVDGKCSTEDEGARPMLDFFGVPNDGSQGIWCYESGKQNTWYSGIASNENYIRKGRHDFKLFRGFDEDEEKFENKIFYDNKELEKKVTNGINVYIYDEYTETIVDQVGFKMTEDFSLKR